MKWILTFVAVIALGATALCFQYFRSYYHLPLKGTIKQQFDAVIAARTSRAAFDKFDTASYLEAYGTTNTEGFEAEARSKGMPAELNTEGGTYINYLIELRPDTFPPWKHFAQIFFVFDDQHRLVYSHFETSHEGL